MVKPGLVQLLDALRREQIAVGDQAGNDAVRANAGNDVIELGMQQGFAAADGDERGAQRGQLINAAVHFSERHRIREIVVFVAIGAGKITAPHGNDVDLDGMAGRKQALRDHFEFAKSTVRGPQPTPDPEFQVCHV